MKILSISLSGFKRFSLGNIQNFTMKMNEQVQLILGTNGSGKSSLMSQLTPLPADSSDYTKDGSKIIKISNKNNLYFLSSTFYPTTRHSFIKNDEELNPGGTAMVYKELVKQEFNITPEIHQLLIGEEKFHNMTPARRREWFTMLSEVSYDYALDVYNRLKERSRDTVGALKKTKNRLVTESSKNVTEEEEKKLITDVEQTYKELNKLISVSAPLDKPIDEYRLDQKTAYEELRKLSTKLLNMRFLIPSGTNPKQEELRDDFGEFRPKYFCSIEDIEEYINLIRHDIVVKETLINSSVLEHDKLNDTLTILLKTGSENTNSLQTKIKLLESDKDAILTKRKLKIECNDPNNSLIALDSSYDYISNILTNIHDNEDGKFSRVKLIELENKILYDMNLSNTKKSELFSLNNKKNHMDTHKSNTNTVCPKCRYSWVIGYSDVEYKLICDQIAGKEEELASLSKVIENTDLEINVIKNYMEQYRNYKMCINGLIILNPLWNYISDYDFLIKSPRKALSTIDIFRSDLNFSIEAEKIDIEIKSLHELIESIEKVGDANLTDIKGRLETCVTTVSGLTQELSELRTCLNNYIAYRNQFIEAADLSSKINVLLSNTKDITATTIEMIRRDTINQCVRQLQHSLAIKQEALTNFNLRKGIIADLEDQINKLTLEDEALKLLVKNLSPTDGLIADGLFGFIKYFTNQMNHLISKVWSYPLQIMNCGLSGSEGTELDYKFPLKQSDSTVSDVRYGSTGMKELVDTVFKLVAMKYLGLSESPLMLDEIGANLDAVHRTTMSSLIRSLIETQSFTQLFMVSHYEASYGSYANAEVCVLDKTNIVIPYKHNEHVTF